MSFNTTQIRAFLSLKRFALAGVKRNGEGFGNKVLQHMLQKGYEVIPIHPQAEEVGGVRCCPSLIELPVAVDGLILVVPPDQSELLVHQADIIGIRRIWMQPGAESEEVLTYCDERCLEVIHDACLLQLA